MRDRFTNEYIAITFAVMLIVSGILTMFLKNPKPYVLGWMFGSLIAMAMFKLMYFTLIRAVEKTEKNAQSFVSAHYLIRFLIYGIVLAISAKAPYLSLAATFFGLLSVKYVILIRNLYDYLLSKKGGGF